MAKIRRDHLTMMIIVIGVILVVATLNIYVSITFTLEIEPDKAPLNIEAAIFINLNGFPAEITQHAVYTLLTEGGWENEIVILTDRPGRFQSHSPHINIIETRANTILEAKMTKCQLLHFPPLLKFDNLIYFDSDLFITRPLEFLSQSASASVSFFEDAGGHIMNFCSGCDFWHTGVMIIRRSRMSSEILDKWCNAIEALQTTDQEALDSVVLTGAEQQAIQSLSKKDLLFMRDYIRIWLMKIGFVVKSDHIFEHHTGLGGEGVEKIAEVVVSSRGFWDSTKISKESYGDR